jgi:hypothetical protein
VEVFALVPDVIDEAITEVFDAALETIRDYQVAYGATLGHSVMPVTRRSLPPMMPVYVFDPETLPDRRHEHPILFLPHQGALPAVDTDETIEPDRITALEHFYEQIGERSLFRSAEAMLLAGRGQIDDYDNATAALTLIASGCEVLLDHVLASLLWEEGQRPEDATPIFETFVTNRLKAGHHESRVGGDWDLDGSGPIANWLHKIAFRRNAMLHAGQAPTLDIAKEAFGSAIELLDFLRGRLLAHTERYPRTAWGLLGSRLMPAGDKQRHIDPLLNDANEPLWKATAARWLRTMRYACRHGEWMNAASESENLALVAVLWPDGTMVWCVVDETLARAHRIADPKPWVSQAQLDGLANSQLAPRTSPMSIRLVGAEDSTAPLPTVGPWVAAYRLLPNVAVMVTGELLDPP